MGGAIVKKSELDVIITVAVGILIGFCLGAAAGIELVLRYGK